jgi:hypothetical protein
MAKLYCLNNRCHESAYPFIPKDVIVFIIIIITAIFAFAVLVYCCFKVFTRHYADDQYNNWRGNKSGALTNTTGDRRGSHRTNSAGSSSEGGRLIDSDSPNLN